MSLLKECTAKMPKKWDREKSIVRAKKSMHAALNTNATVLFIISLFIFGWMHLWNEWYIDPLCAAVYELG